MNVILYKFKYRKTDIVKNLANDENYTCTLRFPTNILNPIIRIQLDEPTTTIKNWSYAYIEDFGKRYYFVENVVAFTNNIYDLYLHVDVLFTYIGVTNGIFRNSSCWLTRTSNSSLYNKLLMDSRVTYGEKNSISYYKIADITQYPFYFQKLNSSSRNVLVTVICDVDLTNIVGFDGSDNKVPYECYYPTIMDGEDVSPRSTNYNCGSITYLLTAEQARALAQECLKSASTRSYIKSFIVFPFGITQILSGTNYAIVDQTGKITFGVNGDYHIAQTPSGASQDVYICKRAMFSFRAFTCYTSSIKSSINNGNDYLNYGNYTKYEFYIPYVGYVDIDWNMICRGSSDYIFKVQFSGDLETGDMSADIIIDGVPYKTFKMKVGLNVNLSSTNLYENGRMKEAVTLQEAATSISSILAMIGGAVLTATGYGSAAGVPMMLGGVGGLAASVISAEGNKEKIIDYGFTGTSSASQGLLGLQQFIWRVTTLIPSYDRFNSTIINEIGIPCMQTTTVSACKGYNEFGKCEFALENVKEEEELEELLKKGVHFPTGTW